MEAPPVAVVPATVDQIVALERSANVCLEAEELPTAKQVVALVHRTPLSAAEVVPLGFGLATIAQLVPFQRSTKVFVAELVEELPTAKQLVAVIHDTPLRAM